MQKCVVVFAFLSFVFGIPFASFATEPTIAEVEAKFSNILRNTKVSSIRPSPVKGLYEIITGPNVIYFSPDGEGHFILGQIVDRNGKNLTAEIQNKLSAEYQR